MAFGEVGAMVAVLVRQQAASVAHVRRRLAADLMTQGVAQDRVDDVTLVASELVANAVRHADPSPAADLGVSWTITPCSVIVSVADADATAPQLRVATSDEPTGRGLTIIDQLSSTWGVEPLADGKRVWARVPIQ